MDGTPRPPRPLILAVQALYIGGICWMTWKTVPQHRRELLQMRLRAWARPRVHCAAQMAGRAGMARELAGDPDGARKLYDTSEKLMRHVNGSSA